MSEPTIFNLTAITPESVDETMRETLERKHLGYASAVAAAIDAVEEDAKVAGAPGCPNCGAEQHHWIGHEIRGVYDGVLHWHCSACGVAWSRGWEGNPRLKLAAEQYVREWNAQPRCQVCGEHVTYDVAGEPTHVAFADEHEPVLAT